MSVKVNSNKNIRNPSEIDDITERMDDVRERLKQLDSFLSSNAAVDSNFDDNNCKFTKYSINTYSYENNKSDDIYSDVCSTTTSLNTINNNSSECSKAAHFCAQTASPYHTSTINTSHQSQKEFALLMPKRKVALQPQRRRLAWYHADHNRNERLLPTSHNLEGSNIIPYSESVFSNTSTEELEEEEEECKEESLLELQERESETELIVKAERCAEGCKIEEMSNLGNNENIERREEEDLQEGLRETGYMHNEKNDFNIPIDMNNKENGNPVIIHSKEEKCVTISKELPSGIVEEMQHHKPEDSKTYNDSSNANSNSKTVQAKEVCEDAIERKENKPPLFLTRNLSGLYGSEQPFNLLEAVQKRLQRKQGTTFLPLTEEHTKLTSLYETCLSSTEKNYVQGANNYTNANTEHNMQDLNFENYVQIRNVNNNDDDNNNENRWEQSPESPVRDCSTETAAPERSPKPPLLQLQSEINNCQEQQLQHWQQETEQSWLHKELEECKNVNARPELCEKELVYNIFNEESSHYNEQELTTPLHDATIKIKVTLCELLSLLQMRRWVQAPATENMPFNIQGVDNTNRMYTLLVTSQEHAALLLQRSALHTQRTEFNYYDPICQYRVKNDEDRKAFSNTNNDYLYSGRSADSNRCNINKSTLHRKNVENNVCHSTKLDRGCGKQMRTRTPVWREAIDRFTERRVNSDIVEHYNRNWFQKKI